jgi:hypothetical protein
MCLKTVSTWWAVAMARVVDVSIFSTIIKILGHKGTTKVQSNQSISHFFFFFALFFRFHPFFVYLVNQFPLKK